MVYVSVIMPVFNKEKYLKNSIESVLKQTFTDFELIIIDDGSTDNSNVVAKILAKKDNRIKYIFQENNGVSSARNKGIKWSEGEYISFLDADDMWERLFLEKMVNSIKDYNVSYCGRYEMYKNVKKKKRMQFFKGNILIPYLQHKVVPPTGAWLIRKKFLKDNHILFDEDLEWGEDILFYSKVLFYEDKVKYVSEYLIVYIKAENSLSSENLNKIEKDKVWMNKLKKFIRGSNNINSKIPKQKIISVIDGYRLPASIIYRIKNNLETESTEALKDVLIQNKFYLNKINLSNGIRSLKLLYTLKQIKKTL